MPDHSDVKVVERGLYQLLRWSWMSQGREFNDIKQFDTLYLRALY